MMNNVSLVGRLTKDPELRFTPQGTAVCNFTIAVNRNYKNQQGEQEADFIMIQVWRKPAENAAKFLGKGSLVGITGRIQTRNYENQEGKRVYVTEILAEQVDYLDTRKNNNGQGGGNGNYQGGNQNQNQYNDYQNGGQNQNQNQQNNYQQRGNQNQGYGNQQQDNYNPFGNAQNMQIDIADDDLPF